MRIYHASLEVHTWPSNKRHFSLSCQGNSQSLQFRQPEAPALSFPPIRRNIPKGIYLSSCGLTYENTSCVLKLEPVETPEGPIETDLVGPQHIAPGSEGLGWVHEFAVLSHSQVMLMLLVQKPHRDATARKVLEASYALTIGRTSCHSPSQLEPSGYNRLSPSAGVRQS